MTEIDKSRIIDTTWEIGPIVKGYLKQTDGMHSNPLDIYKIVISDILRRKHKDKDVKRIAPAWMADSFFGNAKLKSGAVITNIYLTASMKAMEHEIAKFTYIAERLTLDDFATMIDVLGLEQVRAELFDGKDEFTWEIW